MKKYFKKILAVTLSAALLSLSFSAFAVEVTDENTVDKFAVLETESAPAETVSEAVWDMPTLLMLSATEIASGKCGDNLTWTLDSNGTFTISGTGDMYDYADNPSVSWHNYKNSIKNLVIPDSITSIGDYAFNGCSGLTGNLVIPYGVTSIGRAAFKGCSSLTGNLVIPNSVTSVGNYAFYGCSGFTGNLVIPNSVTSISDNTFYDCSGFTGNLVIPNSITSIGTSAFNGCSGFTGNLLIPDSITSIDDSVFRGCSGLTGNLVIPNSVANIGNSAFARCSGFTGNLVIPDSVTSIGTSAFNGCSSFTGNLVIPDSVTAIANYTFYGCSGFTGNLVIPNSVTSVGNYAFLLCSGLTDMYIPRNEDSIETGNFPNRVHWKYDLSKCTASISDQLCTGNAIVPDENSITVTSPNGKTLYYGSDYLIENARNNVSVGTATAHIAPPSGGISVLSQDVPFNIVGIDLSGATVTFPEDITYQGEPCKPEPTVVVDGKTLVKDKDYSISYSENNGVGTGKATITGIGNYIGSVNAEFEIEEFDPNKGDRTDVPVDDDTLVEGGIQGTFVYNGAAHTPKPKLVYHFTNPTTGVTLDYDMIEGKDYEIVSYANNIEAGIARVNIKGTGTFIGNTSVTFGISPCELSNTVIADIPSAEYCKKDICPNPEIKIGDKVMVKDVDYELSYENNLNRGTATVTITGKGNLSGTITKNFEITPRDGTKFTIIIWL